MKSVRVGDAIAIVTGKKLPHRHFKRLGTKGGQGQKPPTISPVWDLVKSKVFVTDLPQAVARRAAERLSDVLRRDYWRTGNTSLGDPWVLVNYVEIMVPHINRFIELQNQELHENPLRLDAMGGAELLSEKSGINIRKLAGYRAGEFNFMSFDHVDKLVHAIGIEHLMAIGEIPFERNPNWHRTMFRRFNQHATRSE